MAEAEEVVVAAVREPETRDQIRAEWAFPLRCRLWGEFRRESLHRDLRLGAAVDGAWNTELL